jgi:SAM-dependent methyltransferase
VRWGREYFEAIRLRLGLGSRSQVVEIASNDGYLLQWMTMPCYGIEPTRTGDKAKAKGIQIYPQFFSEAWATNAVYLRGKADLMIANNVLAHVPDINDFVRGFKTLLKPRGVAVFEFPHLLSLVREAQFDTIYHEHYSYLSLTAVDRIFAENGLEIFDVEKLDTHGGSLRVFAGLPGEHRFTNRIKTVLLEEREEGMTTPEFYTGLQAKAEKIKLDLLRFLCNAQSLGREVVAFGDAAKGNTLLNYAGVKGDLVRYVVDETPAKQGKYLPGSSIPVYGDFISKPAGGLPTGLLSVFI